ncbi:MULTISPECIES: hypothetical protein [Brachyspira]|nr:MULTISPECIES: hypothetical protein [Brachyspira]PPS21189.1 hypothetical protein DJ52_12230 [Brachyspira murdochii]
MPRTTISDLDKRTASICHRIGINEDGSSNGNGLINTMKEIKEQLDSHEKYLDNLSEDMVKIDYRLEKLESLAKVNNEEQQKIINEMKEIKKNIDDSITSTKIKKAANFILLLAGVTTAFGTILGTIYFFTNHFIGK